MIPRTIGINFQFHTIYRQFQTRANSATISQKIFMIHGRYITIRKELTKRGWLEKCPTNRYKNLQNLAMFELITNAHDGNDYEIMALSRLIERIPIKFYWIQKNSKWKSTPLYMPYVNSIKRDWRLDFTTKEGLIGCIESSHWNIIDGISDINVPRYHRLRFNTEHIEFLEDYRTTYCLSLLQFIRETYNNTSDLIDLFHDCGTIPIQIIDFALAKIKSDLADRNCDDVINESKQIQLKKQFDAINMEWMIFYYNVDHLINGKNKIHQISTDQIYNYAKDCNSVMAEADKYWPLIQSDGYNNLWIIKPAFACRGWGITIKNNFENILGFIGRRHKIRYIVQKYIERPLLIYNTKFDIRQYILLTITDTRVNIWMYKECYFRFSSQEYNITDLTEAVHITNNAIQRKYKNGKRSNELPAHNMWSLKQFQLYLQDIGNDNMWLNKIYPGMKKNIIGIILTSLEETEILPNTFELYGCDFMLNENFEPILIEINATPDMSPSTIITAKLCKAVLEDVIKVIIDLPTNRKANIGQFELVHSIPYASTNPLSPSCKGLEIIGKKIRSSLGKSN